MKKTKTLSHHPLSGGVPRSGGVGFGVTSRLAAPSEARRTREQW